MRTMGKKCQWQVIQLNIRRTEQIKQQLAEKQKIKKETSSQIKKLNKKP